MAKAEKQIEVADYENTIQTAFGEVSNALTACATHIDQARADREYVTCSQRY
ncbi:hypothetical protein PQQ69_14670 [Paraburkholderia aromaticivorans]